MATTELRDACYHPIRATEAWRDFVSSVTATATDTVDERAERDRERHDETTYARHEPGGHGGR